MNKIVITLQREGFVVLFKKIFRRANYKIKRHLKNNKPNRNRWRHLKGKYKGERVFLLGNGPSLNKTPLYFLKNEYTMCFNHFNILDERLNWFPDFYMSTDNLVVHDIIKSVDSIADKSKFVFLPDIHFRGDNFIKKTKNLENLFWLEQIHGQGFSTELPKVNLGGSVIYEGFQVLNYLGFKEIYFIGVDMNFQTHTSVKNINAGETDIISEEDDDPNHFDPRYFGKNKKFHQPEDYVVNFILNNLKYLSKVADKFNLRIFNAGYDSKVEFFPKVDFKDFFNLSMEEKESLFNECLSQNTSYKSVSDFLKDSQSLSEKSEFKNTLGNFSINEEQGIALIAKAVFSHIPFGPYKNRYYFVKRDKASSLN